MSASERNELTSVIIDGAHRGGMLAVASFFDHATRVAVERAVSVAERGADLMNVLVLHQRGADATSVHEHVESVLTAISPTPTILQVVPSQDGASLDAGPIAAIASRAPNLVCVKVESTQPVPLITALAEAAPRLGCLVGSAGVQIIDGLRRGRWASSPGVPSPSCTSPVGDDGPPATPPVRSYCTPGCCRTCRIGCKTSTSSSLRKRISRLRGRFLSEFESELASQRGAADPHHSANPPSA
ncbi:hypothetical protein [Agromyces sp. Root81]|uniref:hypothetical protein n=1 Tax=Agromyces sp. Root81 TaxID=1736601 RepID=UPI0012F88FFF|nr:hypothetical protein [Agromyces sp. Root81]